METFKVWGFSPAQATFSSWQWLQRTGTIDMSERCDGAYKRLVRLKCYDALESAGFVRYRKEGVDWPMENGFHCWVGLNTVVEQGCVEINPFVGVHVVPIEKLWTSLKTGRYPGRYHRGDATYGLHMGELAPKERVFRFDRQTDVAAEADRLARLYTDVGLSYALSIGTYSRLLPLLRERIAMLGGYPERVASWLYLMDQKEEARAFAESFLKGQQDYFEGFADPFLKMLSDCR